MIINIKTNRSIEEIENILSLQKLEKYPRRYQEYDLGINWVKNKTKFLCLFYEDGSTDRHGNYLEVKQCFYGKVIRFKEYNRIVGISTINIVVLVKLLLLLLFAYFIGDEVFNLGFDLIGIIFVSFVLAVFVNDILKGNSEIKKYLISKFG